MTTRTVVTGVAGFIGSTLAETLLEDGHEVLGIDCFTDYYDIQVKRDNIRRLVHTPGFSLVQGDIRDVPLQPFFEGVDVVFHQAGQPGVRLSWSEGFGAYTTHNVLATQRVLEAAVACRVPRVVYASSSSVYGNTPSYPTEESALPAPHSPYGVTKLAAEHLACLYARNWGLSTVSLRYFTVYGPRQRPDMAIHRVIEAAITGAPFPLFGDGSAVRDFTYVGDAVAANVAAWRADVAPGTVVNVAGGSDCSMRELIELVGDTVGRPIDIDHRAAMPGDVQRTGGSIERTSALLGWSPQVPLAEGVAAQARWHEQRAASVA